MSIMLVAAIAAVGLCEQAATPQLADGGQVAIEASAEGDYAGGNMEGKESRFGVDDSSLWAAYTTAALQRLRELHARLLHPARRAHPPSSRWRSAR